MGKKTVLVSGHLCVPGSITPPSGEEVESVYRVCGIFDDFLCPFPGPSIVGVLKGGQGVHQ